MIDTRMIRRAPGAARGARTGFATIAACTALLASGCVDSFGGSKIEILFASSVPVAGDGRAGAPPLGTHLELYAVRDDIPVHVLNFQLEPIVRADHPCFIENDRTFPLTTIRATGLHSTQWYQRSFEIYDTDDQIADDEAGALADALRRTSRDIPGLEREVIAVTGTPFGPREDDTLTAADIAARLADVPPPSETDEVANARRARLCEALFADTPDLYVGNDRLITTPLNGVFFGVVDGQDPRSGGFIGGASLDLPARLDQFDALRINWQFDDPADPRAEPLGNSPTGYHFMAGVPEHRTRGVINVHLENNDFPSTAADLGIFTNLDDDTTGF